MIVDGMNVIGSRPDRWWRDRKGAMRRLAALLENYAREEGADITVVFDSRPFELSPDPGVHVVFASTSRRNAADDEIVRIVERDVKPESLQVVTSDVALASRVKAFGATVIRSGEFRDRLEEAAGQS